MTTDHPALAEIERLVDSYGRSERRTIAVQHEDSERRADEAQTALLDAIRSALRGPLTVGAALALDGVAEFDDEQEGWMQMAVDLGVIRWRYLLTGVGDEFTGWCDWGTDELRFELLAIPCRLIPLADADRDPSTRRDPAPPDDGPPTVDLGRTEGW